MATRDFEVQQLLKAYRQGFISDQLFAKQMEELGGQHPGTAKDTLQVANVFAYRDKSLRALETLQKTPHSHTGVFTVPAGFSAGRENTHRGDQIIYVIEGHATVRVSGRESELKAGDVLMIPAEAPHTLRTGSEPLFAFTVFTPPED